MSFLALNLVLAFIWMLLLAEFTTRSLFVGLLAGFVAIALLRGLLGADQYVRGVCGTGRLAVGLLVELVIANLQLAKDTLRPVPPFRPSFIAFDIRDLPPLETVVLANLVSLTPGTLSVDSDDEGHTLYVHAMYGDDPEAVRAGIRRLANLVHGALGQEGK